MLTKAAWKIAGQKINRLAGHDWQPGVYPVHFSTCKCGLGLRLMISRKDWRLLKDHPLPPGPPPPPPELPNNSEYYRQMHREINREIGWLTVLTFAGLLLFMALVLWLTS